MALMERQGELKMFADLLAACLTSRGGVAVISGPSGSGKTALLHACVKRAIESGVRHVGAVASRAEQSLPLAVVGQLLRHADVPPEKAVRLARLLRDGALAAALNEPGTEIVGEHAAPILHELCMEVLDLADRGPLMIGVDDIQHADGASLQCLLYLARRLGAAAILLLLTERTGTSPAHPGFHAGLPEPNARRVPLAPLSLCGVAAVLAEETGAASASLLTSDCCTASGGNPLLVRALAEDYRTSAQTMPGQLAPGRAFGQAVAGCLHRCDAATQRVARALAVLGEPATADLTADLLGLGADVVAKAMTTLEAGGLLASGRFRHAAARAAVLDDLLPSEKAAMHARAAQLLHWAGAAATAVARHLVEADGIDAAWILPPLLEAAEESLGVGDLNLALACLRTADQACCPDARRRATITSLRARAEWRINPAAASRHLRELTVAIRDGHLTGQYAIIAVNYLLWHGRVDEALEALAHLSVTTPAQDRDTAAEIDATRLRACYLYPERSRQILDDERASQPTAASGAVSPRLQAAGGPAPSAVDDEVTRAEQVLQQSRLDDATLWPIMAALAALIHAEQPDRAANWCDSLLEAATACGAPSWHAVLTAVRAMISLRQGNLTAAEELARAALTALPPKSWGVAIGAPLATVMFAASAAGRHREAAVHLALPVPKAMFDTPFGLYYLQARGWHHLAADRCLAALGDFRACGELMARWHLDTPRLVSWRTDAAQACVRLGREREARVLAQEQLDLLASGPSRMRGVCLRVLASASELPERPALLRKAAVVLQECGDRLELAYACVDLSRAHHALGETSQARTVARSARRLATLCGADAACRTLMPDLAGTDVTMAQDDLRQEDGFTGLSGAEQRVAALAARGYTNREIASTLVITVSTVEQHLTQVYRKLNLRSRSDLPLTQRRVGGAGARC